MAKASYPDQIFLQLYGIDGEYEVDDDGNPTDLSEVTWSVGKVYDTDIKYVLDKRHRPKKKGKRGSK